MEIGADYLALLAAQKAPNIQLSLSLPFAEITRVYQYFSSLCTSDPKAVHHTCTPCTLLPESPPSITSEGSFNLYSLMAKNRLLSDTFIWLFLVIFLRTICSIYLFIYSLFIIY